MKESPSFIENRECQDCQIFDEAKKYVVPLPNRRIAHDENYSNLELKMNQFFSTRYFGCVKCDQTKCKVEFRLGKYLCIDSEDPYSEYPNFRSTLDHLPTEMNLKGIVYILIGAIRFEKNEVISQTPGFETLKGISHYIAYYVRNISSNRWIKKDDLLKKSSKVDVKNSKRQLHMLFYVEKEEINYKPYDHELLNINESNLSKKYLSSNTIDLL